MSYDYDALYAATPNALGDPTKIIVDFFSGQAGKSLRVLDIGCGQGRDALFIARAGHSVVGVDLSANGIRDMLAVAQTENLAVEGIVADLASFTSTGIFDVLLIDRTLHMLDEEPRHECLRRLLQCVAANGWTLIEDERSNIAGFKDIFAADGANWHIETEKRGTLFLRRV